MDAMKQDVMNSLLTSDAEQGEDLRELRCPTCRRLLMKEYIFKGKVEVYCTRCGETHLHVFKSWKK